MTKKTGQMNVINDLVFSFSIKDIIGAVDKISIRAIDYITVLFQYYFPDFNNYMLIASAWYNNYHMYNN